MTSPAAYRPGTVVSALPLILSPPLVQWAKSETSVGRRLRSTPWDRSHLKALPAFSAIASRGIPVKSA